MKVKKFGSFIISIIIMCNILSIGFTVSATSYGGVSYEMLNYVYNDDLSTSNITEVYIGSNLHSSGAITVPEKFTINNTTYKIVGIEEEAFYDSLTGKGAGITSIALPSTITYIGREAFKNCSYLQRFSFPASLKQIGAEAFSGCSELSNIYVDAKSTDISIDKTAFPANTKIHYLQTISASGQNGKVTVSKTSAMGGKDVTLTVTAIPNSGYKFSGWNNNEYLDDSKSTQTVTFKMPDKNISFVANFSANEGEISSEITGAIINDDLKSVVSLNDLEKNALANGKNIEIKFSVAENLFVENTEYVRLITENLGDKVVKAYYDVMLTTSIDGEQTRNITQTSSIITITITVEPNLERENISLVSVHDNALLVNEILNYDAVTGSLTFKTNAFSIIALLYNNPIQPEQETEESSSEKSDVQSNSSSSSDIQVESSEENPSIDDAYSTSSDENEDNSSSTEIESSSVPESSSSAPESSSSKITSSSSNIVISTSSTITVNHNNSNNNQDDEEPKSNKLPIVIIVAILALIAIIILRKKR